MVFEILDSEGDNGMTMETIQVQPRVRSQVGTLAMQEHPETGPPRA